MTALDRYPDDEPPARPRASPERPPPEDTDDAEAAPFDPDRDLWGAVFLIRNRQWGFESATSDEHPGACAHYRAGDRDAVLLKGTDADHLRCDRGYYFVPPNADNGLTKLTAFALVPRYFRVHRLRTYHPQRYLGRLDEATRLALCDELARTQPED